MSAPTAAQAITPRAVAECLEISGEPVPAPAISEIPWPAQDTATSGGASIVWRERPPAGEPPAANLSDELGFSQFLKDFPPKRCGYYLATGSAVVEYLRSSGRHVAHSSVRLALVGHTRQSADALLQSMRASRLIVDSVRRGTRTIMYCQSAGRQFEISLGHTLYADLRGLLDSGTVLAADLETVWISPAQAASLKRFGCTLPGSGSYQMLCSLVYKPYGVYGIDFDSPSRFHTVSQSVWESMFLAGVDVSEMSDPQARELVIKQMLGMCNETDDPTVRAWDAAVEACSDSRSRWALDCLRLRALSGRFREELTREVEADRTPWREGAEPVQAAMAEMIRYLAQDEP